MGAETKKVHSPTPGESRLGKDLIQEDMFTLRGFFTMIPSYCFRNSGLQAKFLNPSTTFSGRKVRRAERK